jgi:hypothetical protein
MYLIKNENKYQTEIQTILKDNDMDCYINSYILCNNSDTANGYLGIYTGQRKDLWIISQIKDGKIISLNNIAKNNILKTFSFV